MSSLRLSRDCSTQASVDPASVPADAGGTLVDPSQPDFFGDMPPFVVGVQLSGSTGVARRFNIPEKV